MTLEKAASESMLKQIINDLEKRLEKELCCSRELHNSFSETRLVSERKDEELLRIKMEMEALIEDHRGLKMALEKQKQTTQEFERETEEMLKEEQRIAVTRIAALEEEKQRLEGEKKRLDAEKKQLKDEKNRLETALGNVSMENEVAETQS